jgi:hypothetical protein
VTPQPNSNVDSAQNGIDMSSTIETYSNIEGEVHQYAPAGTDKHMSDSFNINIGLVPIVETGFEH